MPMPLPVPQDPIVRVVQQPAPVIVQLPSPVGGGSPSARAIYDALRNQRREVANQIDDVQGQRDEIARQLRQPNLSDADKAGLQQRLVTLDQRLVSLDLQKAESDAAVAKQAAIPGSIVIDPPRPRDGPPEEVFALSGLFLFVVVFPLTIAYARRIWRRGAPTAMPQEIYDRFTRVEQSLDTIAIEIERVGEGQRFLTRMQAQQSERALGAGPAERMESANRERAGEFRK
jgi:hypothetical protein